MLDVYKYLYRSTITKLHVYLPNNKANIGTLELEHNIETVLSIHVNTCFGWCCNFHIPHRTMGWTFTLFQTPSTMR